MKIIKKIGALVMAVAVMISMTGHELAYAALFNQTVYEEFGSKIVTGTLIVDYGYAKAYTVYTQGSGEIYTSVECTMYRQSIPIPQYYEYEFYVSETVSTPGTAMERVDSWDGYAMKNAESRHYFDLYISSDSNWNGVKTITY